MSAEPQGAEAARLSGAAARRQRVVRTRRQYNQWAANQTLEDYALRFTAEGGRRFTIGRIGNTALGSIAFLACEAVGASITLDFGLPNALAALAVFAVIVLVTGFPICFYAARYGVDMDLLTRGSGFGYIGSTITSAIYACFTFILFAIEAAILSTALELCFGVPLAVGHLISALIVLPIAAYGVKRISWMQNWTQPVWLVLQLAPLIYIALHYQAVSDAVAVHAGRSGWSWPMIGAAVAVLLSLLPQIGEQVDYLRFLPPRRPGKRFAWWSALTIAGPGWILIGGVKILIGAALACLAVGMALSPADAAQPARLYDIVFLGLTHNPAVALALTALFVAVCQIKINVTNAYAGSIAASNFFSRLTHRHPGRVVWLVFNIFIALQLMEIGIMNVVAGILALYANFAVAWIGAVTADLLINKPLGLSPKGIEFKRAHLYDINPVGVGAMGFSLIVSTVLFWGVFGPAAKAFSPLAGLAAGFVAAPAIAKLTRGRYYLARTDGLAPGGPSTLVCTVCENPFERPDMAFCPVYQGAICSLCCTLEARCHDACKPEAPLIGKVGRAVRRWAPAGLVDGTYPLVARFVITLLACALGIGGALWLVYDRLGVGTPRAEAVGAALLVVFAAFMTVAAFAVWFFILASENQHAAESESDRQTTMLLEEIEAHERTDAALQRAKEVAETANRAKSRYIVGVSHEIRAPLNAISGYAQLLERNPNVNVPQAVRVIRRSATHLADLVNGLLDISRIENGTLRLENARVNLIDLLGQVVDMFRLQAANKGLAFHHAWPDNLPAYIYGDEKRLRQILINLLSNAIKYTDAGGASLTVRWSGQTAEFIVADTGQGIDEGDLERIFEPFERLGGPTGAPGVGLGLTITKVLVTVLGGDIQVRSEPGKGSAFSVKLHLSERRSPGEAKPRAQAVNGYRGPRRRILVTDDDPVHLDLVRDLLGPLGFDLTFARDGEACLAAAARQRPDLAMMDVSMPGMDGWTAARALRARLGPDLAILMVSANGYDFSRSRREDDPHDDFLIKPYEVDDLHERLRVLLDLEWRHDDPAGAANAALHGD
ncbi:ATP-binding protein [Phenylobacterium sp. LjRoot225]|uniref:hybrid sensor histidine kinase/response regulator n=1 Tax=Phenylobacterium sp. LjRoot225 TaxID=3342285 RepID=UPI003ED09D36